MLPGLVKFQNKTNTYAPPHQQRTASPILYRTVLTLLITYLPNQDHKGGRLRNQRPDKEEITGVQESYAGLQSFTEATMGQRGL